MTIELAPAASAQLLSMGLARGKVIKTYVPHWEKEFIGRGRIYFTHYGMRKKPSFNGKHNEARVKTLLVLNSARGKSFTLSEIANLSGCSYDTLKRSLTKWCRWRFLTYKLNKYGIRQYRILIRGVKYLQDWQPLIPKQWYDQVAEAKSELVRRSDNGYYDKRTAKPST